MAYKVNYCTFAIMDDGSIGNLTQSSGHFYTNSDIKDVLEILNKYLFDKKKIGVIKKIEYVGGICL
ncbi:MAG: hypothetical protein M0R17_08675 [Candidatus Omnitrophica bacterium]|jgi:hypothetical protein|nr:hypothetical protein [Candidatus Omnitrophota bacterium]